MFWYKVPVTTDINGAIVHVRDGVSQLGGPGLGCWLHTLEASDSPTHALLGSPSAVSPVPSDWTAQADVNAARTEFSNLIGRAAVAGEVE